MKKIENRKALNIIIITVVVIIFALAIAYLAPIMKDISTPEGRIAFRERIYSLGPLGILLLFTLQVAQILLVVIPGEPLELLAGMCYGVLNGTVFITMSVFITTTIIFYTVRRIGRKFVYDSFNKEKVEKLEKNKLLSNPRKVEMIMILLFMIPGTPKDLLVYIGGLLPVKGWRFILISTFARFPSVISSAIVGANIVSGNFKIGIIAYAITFIITATILILVNVFDKESSTKETLKALK